MRIRAMIVAAVVATGAVFLVQSPALAVSWALIDAPNWTYGYAKSDRVQEDIFLGCDTTANNIGVYGRFFLNDLRTIVDVPDSNGSSSGCGVRDYTATPYWAWGLQAIQRDGKASAKINTDGPGGS